MRARPLAITVLAPGAALAALAAPASARRRVGSLYADDRLSADNANNTPGESSYGLVLDGCWNGDTPLHENGHNMGAVQAAAPHSTGSGFHCAQDLDVVCYSPDGGDRNQDGTARDCADRKHLTAGTTTTSTRRPSPASTWRATGTSARR